MKDTSKDMLDRWHANLDALSPEERVKMTCSMFEFARDLVVASIRNADPAVTDAELSRQVLLRFYGQDIDVAVLAKTSTSGGTVKKLRG